MTDPEFLPVARGAHEAGIEVKRRGPDMLVATRGADQIWVKIPGIAHFTRCEGSRQLAGELATIITTELPGTSVTTSTRRIVVTQAAPVGYVP